MRESRPIRHLILMMKAPEPGRVKTRLALDLGSERATAYYRRFVELLVRRVLDAPEQSWQSFVVFDPPDALQAIQSWLQPLAKAPLRFEAQAGGDLGDRLAAAFGRAFEEGATAVLALGTDCLELDADEIEACFTDLESRDIVLGEAFDGGYWCVGMSAPHLGLFDAMPWSQPNLAEATRERARSRGWSLAERAVRLDVDDRKDLDRLPDALKAELGIPKSKDQ
jgi:uncharacterized protein